MLETKTCPHCNNHQCFPFVQGSIEKGVIRKGYICDVCNYEFNCRSVRELWRRHDSR